MRIDSHQHFWRYNSSDYVWMDERMDVLRRDFLPSDLAPELKRLGFDGSIAVQARQMERETEWLLALAVENPFIVGVVGWVDFESPRLDESLDIFSAYPKLRGVRELIHDMPDDYVTSGVHRRAIAKLAAYGLTYDLLLRPRHLPSAIELAREFPEQPFVVDHLAKPDIKKHEIEPWRSGIHSLASCDNVCCKLSGLVTEAAWRQWSAEDFRFYLEVAIEAFGADRLMIGSDWPVCTLSSGYTETMNVVIDFANRLAADERDSILGGCAARFYGVGNCWPATAGGTRAYS